MDSRSPLEITLLLNRWRAGDEDALQEIIPFVYKELHTMAQAVLRGSSLTLLPATDLAHEAYLRLFPGAKTKWENREHFFGEARKIMRALTVDYYRMKKARKRGGDQIRVAMDEFALPGFDEDAALNILALEKALKALSALEKIFPRAGQIIELRFFVGLSVEETAELLGLSDRTVRREWAFAKGWLLDQLQPSPAG